MSDRCHEAGRAIAPFVVVRTDLTTYPWGRRGEELLRTTPGFVEDGALGCDVGARHVERLEERHRDRAMAGKVVRSRQRSTTSIHAFEPELKNYLGSTSLHIATTSLMSSSRARCFPLLVADN